LPAGDVAGGRESLQPHYATNAILGPFVDVFLHESGHAVFDLLKLPVLGREADAADLFSAYVMLQLGKEDARTLILGSAYLERRALMANAHVRGRPIARLVLSAQERAYLERQVRRPTVLPGRYLSDAAELSERHLRQGWLRRIRASTGGKVFEEHFTESRGDAHAGQS